MMEQVNPEKPAPRRGSLTGRLARRAVITVVLTAAVVGLAWLWAPLLLCVENRPAPADAIVVLGGDFADRADRAAELFARGLAPRIVVSGAGDHQDMFDRLRLRGVPPPAVVSEPDSRNTWEDARFSMVRLRAVGAHRVILVTSWYHSRRALACFAAVAPDTQFISLPVYERSAGARARLLEVQLVLVEYAKTLWYLCRGRFLPAHAPAAGG